MSSYVVLLKGEGANNSQLSFQLQPRQAHLVLETTCGNSTYDTAAIKSNTSHNINSKGTQTTKNRLLRDDLN